MRAGGRILARVIKATATAAKIGSKLSELDTLAHRLIFDAGAKPAFLGYRERSMSEPYPATICASVNEVIVHAIPSSYRLRSGDVLKIDVGLIYEGFYLDSARTVGIGTISASARKLVKVTEKALFDAIRQARTGNTLGDIGFSVKKRVSRAGFHVVKGLTGHGIGRGLHEPPTVLNEGRKGEGLVIKPGLVIAIEPMVAIGTANLVLDKRTGGYATVDGSLTAHFEHTVAITKKGPEILTRA